MLKHTQSCHSSRWGRAALIAAAVAMAAPLAAQTSGQQASSQPTKEQKEQTSSQATTVAVNELQANPSQYTGKQVTIEAEVQDVLGPRLLTIDEKEVVELDGDLLVFIRVPFAGLVSERARVTVTGTVQPLVKADIERELRWLDPNTASLVAVDVEKRPMIVATSIKSDMGVELAVRLTPAAAGSGAAPEPKPEGTTGAASGTSAGREAPVTDVSSVTQATGAKLVGRHVNLANARVARAGDNRSFWVSGAQGRDQVLVVPADPSQVKVSEGQTVSIDGVLLQMPRAWRDKFSTTQGTDETVYVFASRVQPAR